jgi:hypothetical protein
LEISQQLEKRFVGHPCAGATSVLQNFWPIHTTNKRTLQSLPTRTTARASQSLSAATVVPTSYRRAKEIEMTSGMVLRSVASFVGQLRKKGLRPLYALLRSRIRGRRALLAPLPSFGRTSLSLVGACGGAAFSGEGLSVVLPSALLPATQTGLEGKTLGRRAVAMPARALPVPVMYADALPLRLHPAASPSAATAAPPTDSTSLTI